MFQLMLKDIYIQRKTAFIAPVFLLIYFLTMGRELENTGSLIAMAYSLAVAFIAFLMLVYSNFNTGETAKMHNRLVLSLPVERWSVINAKYVMVSVWWLCAYISCTILAFILKNVFHEFSFPTFDLNSLIFSLCITYILAAVFYPIYYKFGWKAAQILIVGLFFLFSFGLGKLLSLDVKSGIISMVFKYPVTSCMIITLTIALVSYFLSLRIYEKKEF